MSIIKWLEEWYESNCDGDWEHSSGINIENVDNPGWLIKFDIKYTLYEDVAFKDVTIDRAEHDWVRCRKREDVIHCSGGSRNLEELLLIIKKSIEDNKPDPVAEKEHNQAIIEGREIYGIKFKN